ncbi:MAG: response regulator transcription factor [Sandaracinus sp.]|nr:response regulator transcription factor [Sandaracinus sp.]
MSVRIGLVDDDETLRSTLKLAFEREGFVVQTAADGLQAWAMLEREPPALLVTDVNMPNLDGLSLCRRAREAGLRLPILILSSRDSEIDEALGLDLGADDYVTKPFSVRVLVARVRALLRRHAPPEDEAPDVVSHGALHVDRHRLEARWNEHLLELTVTEVRLLEAFARRPGRVLSRERLLELARGDDESVVSPRIVDTYVARLRRKITAVDADARPIETVVGGGYRWSEHP